MILRAWRIVMAKERQTAFTGQGVAETGAMWNSPGVPVVYTSESRALAMLEEMAHLDSRDFLKPFVVFEIAFDSSLVHTIDRRTLPGSWRRTPSPKSVQKLGDAWAREARSPILCVPSVIIADECNYLLNPRHPDFHRIHLGRAQPLRLDLRLNKDPGFHRRNGPRGRR